MGDYLYMSKDTNSNNKISTKELLKRGLLIAFAIASLFVSSGLALAFGLVFALLFGSVWSKPVKKLSKYLLQFCVVGIGFGMNLIESLKSGKEGMLFTIVSVSVVMVVGMLFARMLKVDRKTGYLVSSGTAICGGSAIAATAPVVKANDNQISVALGTVFVLNAIALFIFPYMGYHWLNMNQLEFGEWAAIAIHDTSSVVGAAAAFDASYFANTSTPNVALETATLIKLTRALWIIPLALVTMFIFKEKGSKISIPWFILWFVVAMIINTYCGLPECISKFIVGISKRGLALTIFLIGTGLSLKTIKEVGPRPLVQGVLLWLVIGTMSAAVIKLM